MAQRSWANVALGVWLIIAGLALPHVSGAGVTEDVIAGSIVALTSLWAVRAFRPTVSLIASWTVTLTGIWVACAPFVLGYERARPAVVNQIIVGVAIAMLGGLNTHRKAALVDNR
jgi:hypothetical protein